MTEREAGYIKIMSTLRVIPVSDKFRAVNFSEDGLGFSGSGTLVLGPSGEHRAVVTAAHLFAQGFGISRAYYRLLQPHDPDHYPLCRLKQPLGEKVDVAMAFPGPIADLEKFPGHVNTAQQKNFQLFKYDNPEPPCLHILTGNYVHIPGYMKDPEGFVSYLLLYHCLDSESGSGFIKTENEIYVLTGRIDYDEMTWKFMGIPASFTRVTTAVGIGIK